MQLGGRAELLCDLNSAELISLLFWYKDLDPRPIYTLDARQLVADKTLLGDFSALLNSKGLKTYSADPRLKLEPVKSKPRQVSLVIEQVQAKDSGLYKCRVDFRRTRTMTRMMQLLVPGKFAATQRLAL